MKTLVKAILMLVVLVGVLTVWKHLRQRGGAGQVQSNSVPPPMPAPQEPWTPERIVKDPQGYIVWSDQQVQNQMAQRDARLKTLAAQRDDLINRQKEMKDNLDAVQNIHARMQTAYNKADDEERWPLKCFDREYSRDAANGVLAKTQKYLDDRQALSHTYDDAIGRVDQLTATINKDLDDLTTLRAKLAVDLENVKLNQGIAEMGQDHKTEVELESMSKTLAAIDQQSAASLPPAKAGNDRADVAEMLK